MIVWIGNGMASDIVEEIKLKYQKDKENWERVYSDAREDLRFLSDDKYAQWDAEAYNDRVSSGRPVVTVDQLGQFIHQVANDIRMNTPTINVIPAGNGADVKVAEAMKSIIKGIEYASGADDAYDFASLMAIKCSLGFIRVDHDYVDGESFEQELIIKRVVNPLACWIDSASIEPDGSDAKHGTILDKIRISEFKAKYPGKTPSCFAGSPSTRDDEFIYIAEHFYIEETERKIALDDNGQVQDYVEGVPYARTRTVSNRKVKRCIVSGEDVLEETYFPGMYIPLVPVYGDEAWEDGERRLLSLIRKSKDSQVLYNFWKSLEVELLMKAPQAPFMAAEGQTEEYMADWLKPSKSMVLRYKQTDLNGQPAPMPQRIAPPPIPDGVMMASRGVVDDIKATMGIYNASLGQRSNEQSGVAIARRQAEGDVATYHFGDNLVKAITQVGRILVNAIPEIYDTARILRAIGAEEEPEEIGVNGATAGGQDETIDLTRGRYDVRVITGAPFTTQRQEAAEFYSNVVTKMPDLMQVMGDLVFKYSDFAGAQAMAERMKKVIDPKFLSEEDRQEEQAQDPEKMQMAQVIQQGAQEMQALQMQNAQLQEQLKNKQADTMLKAQSEQTDAEIERQKLEIQFIQMRMEENKAAQEMALKSREIAIKEKELSLKEQELALEVYRASQPMAIGAQELV